MATMRLYSKGFNTPAPPTVGQRVGNMFQGVWGSDGGQVMAVGGATATYGSKVLTSFDTITEQSMLTDAMAIKPTAAVGSGSGVGRDFNILTANKKYTVGCGMLQNRSNTMYLGFANGNGSGSYFYSSVLPNNEFSYHVFKVIPSGQSEIYPTESGRFSSSFARVGSGRSPFTNTDITRVRMLLGYTASEGAERWQQTLGMFFRPFCYEGETWFDFRVQPWKSGNSTYYCDVEYNPSTMLITSVGSILNDELVYTHDNLYIAKINELANKLRSSRTNRGMPVDSWSDISSGTQVNLSTLDTLLNNLATKSNNFIQYAGAFPSFYTSGTSAQGVPTTGKTLVSSGSVVLTEHFNQINQINSDIRDGLKCNQGCIGNCYASCSTVSCSTSCIGVGCATSCTGGCYTGCVGYCKGSCSGGCTGGCSGGCRGGLFLGCGCIGSNSGCSRSCGLSCSGGCSNNCSSSCWAACSGDCSTSCSNDCTTTCTNLCTLSCSLSAYTMVGRVAGSELHASVVKN
jgi:hypothetical protein